MNAILILENGKMFKCNSFTGSGEAGGEIVFNTSSTGYQEILTDPSYFGQMVLMTYPIVGTCGVNFYDFESDFIYPSAFLVKEHQSYISNFRSKSSLAKYLSWYGVMGIEGIDTRSLTKYIRNFGSMRAYVSSLDLNPKSLISKVRSIVPNDKVRLFKMASTKNIYRLNNGKIKIFDEKIKNISKIWKFRKIKRSIVIFDYGLKFSILRSLLSYNFEIVVVPANTKTYLIEKMNPNGIVLSNGPGNPIFFKYAVKKIKKLISKGFPIFGICLGHQLLGLAMGAKTYRLKFGHRGGNHPVKNLSTGRTETTVQNHGFAIDFNSVKGKGIEITHVNLNDGTIEGLRHTEFPVFSIQYHPEASPGPNDSSYIFEQFKTFIKNF